MKAIQVKKYERKRIALPEDTRYHVPDQRSIFYGIESFIERQQASETRFKWPGIVMATQSIIITPLLAIVVIATGNWLPLWIAVTICMYGTFIPVLAGSPVSQVIKVFFTNLVVSIVIIGVSLAHFFIMQQ